MARAEKIRTDAEMRTDAAVFLAEELVAFAARRRFLGGERLKRGDPRVEARVAARDTNGRRRRRRNMKRRTEEERDERGRRSGSRDVRGRARVLRPRRFVGGRGGARGGGDCARGIA